MKDNNLIERYVYEVGRHLPSRMRADVSLEIKGALEDILEERGIDPERDQKALEGLLIEYGNPEKVAASYLPERYLISPQLFPLFLMVLKIVLAVIGGLTLVGFVVSGVTVGFRWSILWEFFGSLVGNLFTVVGSLAITFSLLEHFGVFDNEKDEDWHPKSLPQLEDPDLPKRGDLITGIIFSAAALVIFNAFPNIVAFYGSHDSVWGVIARLTPEFKTYIPWLSSIWAIEIAMNAEVLRLGSWNRVSRFVEFLHSGFAILVLYRIVEGGSILTLSVLDFIVKGSLFIALIVMSIEWLGQTYRLSRSLISPRKPLLVD